MTSGPTQFSQRIEAYEQSARSLARAFRSSSGDPQIGAAEALLFSNGKQLSHEVLRNGPGSLVGRLEHAAGQIEAIKLAVFNVLSRSPDEEELQVLSAFLAERTDRPQEALRQVVWALMTDSEFRFNH